MSEFMQSLLQGLWIADSWAEDTTPSLLLALVCVLCQAGGVMLISAQAKKEDSRASLMGGALTLALALMALLLTSFNLGWLLLIVPVALSLLCGFSRRPWVRWSGRGLWLGAAAAALVLGHVALAAIIACSLSGWVLAYIARQVEPFEAAALASGKS